MATWSKKTYHLDGIEVTNGMLTLNDNPLKIGEWTFEVASNGDLLIKNESVIQAKISSHSNIPTKNYSDRFFIVDPIVIEECIGMLVSNNNQFYNFDFTQAPTSMQTSPIISLSSKECDPSVLGIISGCENFEREYTNGAFNTVYTQDDGINRVIVSTSGLGSMWVTDMNGLFKNGDFITTSIIPGYGMKQVPSNIQYNFTWAKIIQDCDFNPEIKVLKQPIGFDSEGPVYEVLKNNQGAHITNYEYEIKFVYTNGETASRSAYENDIQRVIDEEIQLRMEELEIEHQELISETDMNDIKDKALSNNSRTVFRACLVAYQR